MVYNVFYKSLKGTIYHKNTVANVNTMSVFSSKIQAVWKIEVAS